MLALGLTLAGVVVAVGAAWFGYLAVRPNKVRAEQNSFVATRGVVQRRRGELAQQCRSEYPDVSTIGDRGLLTHTAWIPSRPLSPRDIHMTFQPEGPPLDSVIRRIAQRQLPLANERHRYTRFTDAMSDLARPSLFDDRPSYRILDLNLAAGTPRLSRPSWNFVAAVRV